MHRPHWVYYLSIYDYFFPYQLVVRPPMWLGRNLRARYGVRSSSNIVIDKHPEEHAILLEVGDFFHFNFLVVIWLRVSSGPM